MSGLLVMLMVWFGSTLLEEGELGASSTDIGSSSKEGGGCVEELWE